MKYPGTYLGAWVDGVDSFPPPDLLTQRQIAWAENCLIRGGVVRTRPGLRVVASFPGQKLQGFTFFKPRFSPWKAVVAVDGRIFQAPPPFEDFTLLEELVFDPTVEQVIFRVAVKSTQRNDDGTLKLITPKRLLMIQDNVNQCASWDGTVAKHLDPTRPSYGPPVGKWMAWSGSRLWIAQNNVIIASDLTDPESFTENTYIAERSNIPLPDTCTGLIDTADEKMLLAFTEDTTTAIRSGILDRSQWQTTPEFTKVVLPKIGCVAGKSVINAYNLTHWLADEGFIDLDAAMFSRQKNILITIDEPMMRSKRTMAPDRSLACAGGMENIVLLSMPSGSSRNSHTWVMDKLPSGADRESKRVWAGIWTGVNPVEWSDCKINGKRHLFFVSRDETDRDDTHLHLWEAMLPDREDNAHAIACQMETFCLWKAIEEKFVYAEVDVVELVGEVHLTAYVGGTRGEWHLILETDLQAEIGPANKTTSYKKEDILKSYRPQMRTVLTQSFDPQGKECSPETDLPAGTDKGFQILIQWTGQMGVKGVRVVTMPDPDKTDGGVSFASEAGQHNIVTERGEHLD